MLTRILCNDSWAILAPQESAHPGGNEIAMKPKGILWLSGVLLVASFGLTIWAGAHGRNDWSVPEEAKKLTNPVPASEATLKAAKDLYGEYCEQCHGDTGKGDGPDSEMYKPKPADFTDAHMMSEMTDGEIFYKMTEGRRPMPSFKKKLTDEQRWMLVNYVKTFAPKPAAPAVKPLQKH